MITPNDIYNKLFEFIKSKDSMAIPDVAEDHISEPKVSDAISFITGILSIELLNMNNSINIEWVEENQFDDLVDIASFIYEKDNPDFLINVYSGNDFGSYIVEWVHGEYQDYIHIEIE